MPFFVDRLNRLVSYVNRNNVNLPVDENITQAFHVLGFTQADGDSLPHGSRLRLVIHHGKIPEAAKDSKFNYPVVRLRMTSQGYFDQPLIATYQIILQDRSNRFDSRTTATDIIYSLQGGKNDRVRLPQDSSQWQKLIIWLLEIEAEDYVEQNKDLLPNHEDVLKFIYTEPYPEALLSHYLLLLASKHGVKATLDQENQSLAINDFNRLANKFNIDNTKWNDLSVLRSIFEKIDLQMVAKC